MKEIPLTKGYKAIVDDEDYDVLSRYKWHAQVTRSGVIYAKRFGTGEHRRCAFYMHSHILGQLPNERIDHKDRNGLNNTRDNLRKCNVSQNLANQKSRRPGKYKGVYETKGKKRTRYIAIAFGDYLGTFDTAEEAAFEYDKAAVLKNGYFALTNSPYNL